MSSSDESVKITLVPKTAIKQVWPEVEPLLKAALEYASGRYSIDDVLKEALAGKTTLWLAVEDRKILAFWITKVYQTPQTKVCAFEWIGGKETERWFDKGMKIVEDFAKDAGCQRIEAHGRKGWQKYLTRHGFEFLSISFEKELD